MSLVNAAAPEHIQHEGTFTLPTNFPHSSFSEFINKFLVQLSDKQLHKGDCSPAPTRIGAPGPTPFLCHLKTADIMSTS